MTVKELREKAVYMAKCTVFTYYFNEDMQELGHVMNGWTNAVATVFDPPREWHRSFIDKLEVVPVVHG